MWYKNFKIIMIGNIISKMGNIIHDFGIAWWLVNLNGNGKELGLVLGAGICPSIIFSPFSGVIADKFNKKKILIISDIFSGLVSISIGFISLYDINNIIILMFLSFLLGTCKAFFEPSIDSIIPKLVPKDKIHKANSTFTTISEIAYILGPIIGGAFVLIPSLGISGLFLINGMSFIISAIIESFLSYNHEKVQVSESVFLSEMKSGFRYVNDAKKIKYLIVTILLVNIFYSSFTILLPVYIKQFLNQPSTFYSSSLLIKALGGILISIIVISSKKLRKEIERMNMFLIVLGVCLSGISIVNNKFYMFPLILLIGMSVRGFNIYFQTIVQSNVEETYLARVFSIIYLGSTLVMPISYYIYGKLSEHLVKNLFIFTGMGILISTLLTGYLIKIQIKKENLTTNLSGGERI